MGNLHGVMNATPTTLVGTAETVAAVSSAANVVNPGGQGVHVTGTVNVSTGTGVFAVVVRVRQGNGLGGALVGNACTHSIGAGVSGSVPFDVVDPTLLASGQQYTVTVQQSGATGNGTINQATICTETATSVE